MIVREPAAQVRSLHLQLLQHHSEQEPSLRRALALEPARREGRQLTEINARYPQVLLYTDRVRYVEQLRRYDAVFAPEQMLVLIYEEFRADNEGTVRTVQRFLGIDDTLPIEVLETNPTVRRRAHLDATLQAVSLGQGAPARALKGAIKLVTPRRLRTGALATIRRRMLFTSPRAPEADLMLELRRRFKPEVQALGEYLGRSDLVSLWGYGEID